MADERVRCIYVISTEINLNLIFPELIAFQISKINSISLSIMIIAHVFMCVYKACGKKNSFIIFGHAHDLNIAFNKGIKIVSQKRILLFLLFHIFMFCCCCSFSVSLSCSVVFFYKTPFAVNFFIAFSCT